MVHFKDFPEFKPTLTPQQMFKAGIHGGCYFREIKSPKTGKIYTTDDYKKFKFLRNISLEKLISPTYDKTQNKFNVKAGSSYETWMEKDWIDESNAPRGWIEWYCYFYSGRRTSDDERQIKRWINFASKEKGRFRIRFQNIVNRAGGYKPDLSPTIQQNLLEWGVDASVI